MEPVQHDEYARLCAWFDGLKKVGVAFSGGVDSTLLLKIAYDQLGDGVVAFTARIGAQSARDLAFTKAFCDELGIHQIVFDLNEFQIPRFVDNPVDRCYLCKQHIYRTIRSMAAQQGVECIVDGTNCDDLHADRPGRRALEEEGISTPFVDCGFTKQDVRALSHDLGLPTWDKPSDSCLYTRIAFDEAITPEKLRLIAQTEAKYRPLKLKRVRARLDKGRMRLDLEI